MIDVDRVPISWREAGPPTGDVVLFLHGLGGSRVAWDPQLRALSALGLRCAAWDMPGYGVSPAPTGRLTFEVLVEAVVGWMNALGAASAHLVGLSLGGMVAQHVALRQPRLVRSLTLVDTSPAFGLDGSTTAEAWIEQRLQPLGAGVTPAAMAADVLRSMMAPRASDTVVGQGVAAMARVPASGLAAAVRCLVTHDVRSELHRVRVPTLVMVGELDAETPPAYSEFIAAAISGARLEVIAGAGHISNLEAPEAVNRLLGEFIRP